VTYAKVHFASAWADALRDGAGRARDAAVARQRVKEQFSIRSMIAHYEAIYEERVTARR